MSKLTNENKLNEWLELYFGNFNAHFGDFLMREIWRQDRRGCWHRYSESLCMIWFCYFCLKNVFILGVAHGTRFLQKLGQKVVIFSWQKFFRTNGFQLKLLISIESLNIFHWKTAKKKSKLVWSWGKFGLNN